jgi:hypothetical protein
MESPSQRKIPSRAIWPNIVRFVNMIYDFQFTVPGKYDQVCQLADPINNPNPLVGCHFFQAGVAFAALSWYSFPVPPFGADDQVLVDHFHDLDCVENSQTHTQGSNGEE